MLASNVISNASAPFVQSVLSVFILTSKVISNAGAPLAWWCCIGVHTRVKGDLQCRCLPHPCPRWVIWDHHLFVSAFMLTSKVISNAGAPFTQQWVSAHRHPRRDQVSVVLMSMFTVHFTVVYSNEIDLGLVYVDVMKWREGYYSWYSLW